MIRIRVFFINCPTLDTEAAAYLILSQNKVQTIYEFEVHHHWMPRALLWQTERDRVLRGELPNKGWTVTKSERRWAWWAQRFPRIRALERRLRAKFDIEFSPAFKNRLGHVGWQDVVRQAVQRYERWFQQSRYGERNFDDSPVIVVTETPIESEFISYCGDHYAVATLADWKRYFAPGSALEFLLVAVQRHALRLGLGGEDLRSHEATRGCLWDFARQQTDTRLAANLAYLCSSCRNILVRRTSEEVIQQVENLISNRWIGSDGSEFSVARNLAKTYSYPLWKFTGLKAPWWSSVSEGFKSETGKGIFTALKWSLVLMAALWLSKCAPDLYKLQLAAMSSETSPR